MTCPTGVTHRSGPPRSGDGSGIAYFGPVLRRTARCARSAPRRSGGRTIRIGRHEQALADARARQADPAWVADYRATRPKVERKLGHLMRRKHGGRRARVRGTERSTPTSGSSPARPTSPEWPCSGCVEPPADGR